MRRMQSVWIGGDTRGLDTQRYDGKSGYNHDYYSHVDSDVLRRLSRYPTGDDVEEAMFKAHSGANFLVNLLRFSDATDRRHNRASTVSCRPADTLVPITACSACIIRRIYFFE